MQDGICYEKKRELGTKKRNMTMDPHVRNAAEKDDVDSLKRYLALKDKLVLLQKDADGIHVVHVACEFGSVKVLSFVLDAVNDVEFLFGMDDDLRRPLHWACWKGHLDCVKILLEYSCFPQEVSRNGFTPAHYAVFGSDQKMAIQIIKLLRQHGVDIAQQDHNFQTPLDVARRFGRDIVAEFLEPFMVTARKLSNGTKSPRNSQASTATGEDEDFIGMKTTIPVAVERRSRRTSAAASPMPMLQKMQNKAASNTNRAKTKVLDISSETKVGIAIGVIGVLCAGGMIAAFVLRRTR